MRINKFRFTEIYNLFIFSNLKFIFIFCSFSIILTSCASSDEPVIEELVKTSPPSYTGSTTKNFTTSSPFYDLVGDCDQNSYGIQYSIDSTTWKDVATGCVNNHFTILKILVNPKTSVFVRAKTKFSYTPASEAVIHFIPPATSANFDAVTFSSAVNDGVHGVTSTGSINFSTQRLVGSKILNTGQTGIVYAQ